MITVDQMVTLVEAATAMRTDIPTAALMEHPRTATLEAVRMGETALVEELAATKCLI